MATSLRNSADELRRAQQMSQSGDLAGAARLCRDLVAREPGNFVALLMLGGIESDLKHFPEADRALSQAVKLNPRSPEALGSYGNVLIELGRREAGIRSLSEAIRLQPNNPASYVFRGFGHAQSGDHEKALADFDAALRLAPGWEFALHNRATALIALNRHQQARPDVEKLLRIAPANIAVLMNLALILTREQKREEALAAIERALAIDPRNAEFWGLRAQNLSELGRHHDALGAIEQAIAIRPQSDSFVITRANVLAALGRTAEALHIFQALAARTPGDPEILIGCANMLMEQERLAEALLWADRCIAANPSHAPSQVLRANLLLHLGRHDESASAYDKAADIAGHYAEAAYHRGSSLLLHGKFLEGWRDFERRWDVADCGFSRPELEAPVWRGEPLNGRSIVIYSEQGIGDTIQFVRFLPRLQEMGARLTLLCHPALIRLFRKFADRGIEVTASCRRDRHFDFQCALMSLPERFGTTVETVPANVPYLFAEPELVDAWRERIGPHGVKIGICWQGNPAGKIDKGRSVPLREFRPVGDIPGVRLISLQRSHGLEQLGQLPEGMRVETFGGFDDGKDGFIDSAAIMQSLDLIISSDTSVAHLAGALAAPVWVALKHTPDWRWMLKRSDSVWYPTMRLFRQTARDDWAGVFTNIASEVRLFIETCKVS